MKKAVVFLMIPVLAVSVAGCGTKSETEASSSVVSASSGTGTETPVQSDLPDFSAFYGMWYNVDTSMAEVNISEEGISLMGDVYQVVDVETEESTNADTGAAYTACTLYTEEDGEGISLKAVLLDETGTNAEYKSLELYDVEQDNEDEGTMVGSYVSDIQYTNGEIPAATEETAQGDTGTSVTAQEPSLSSDDASYYLLDSVELSDGSTESKDEYSDQEFALIYSTESPVMNGMMFSTDTTNMYMLSSENGVMQFETEVPSSDGGSSETATLPMAFDENAGTLTLDCSDTDLGVKKMIFKLVDADEFFSGNRAILKQ